MRYTALLRGINVGGHTVTMDRLRSLFRQLDLADVRTYIQSGNVFFDSDQSDRAALTHSIERHLHAALGYDVPVFLRTVTELEQIVERNPFRDLTVTPAMRLCVVFTAERIPSTLALPLRTPKNDMEMIHAGDYEAYVIWRIIDGRPPSSQGFKELGDRNTTRFYHTLAKILQAAKAG
jgi:uncharacterized protein (DUF1697 family)